MGDIGRMKLLLDTHVILWSVAQPERLSVSAARALEDPANELFYSPISVWEILLLAEKGRVSFATERVKAVRDIFQRSPLREAVLNCQVAIESRLLDLPHQDPADRFITATARVYGLTLVTADARILNARTVPVLLAT